MTPDNYDSTRPENVMRIRILAIPGPWSGAEVHTLLLADALLRRGHDVAILELGQNRYAEHGGSPVPVVHLPLKGPGTPQLTIDQIGARQWRRMLAGTSADVGILVKGDFNIGTASLEATARAVFGRFITIEHLVFPVAKAARQKWLGVTRPRLWLFRQRLRHWRRARAPSLVIAVSDAVRRTLIGDYGFPSGKVFTVQNGVDLQKFQRTEAARIATRARWGVGAEALIFGSVGRLSPMKNHRMAIEAFARIRSARSNVDCKLVLVGDGPARKELAEFALARGVAEDVLFPGFSSEPQAALSAIDVFVLPSHNEGLSLSMLEAMACECVPIATAVGGAPEVLSQRGIGWLVEPGNIEEFHAAMMAGIESGIEQLRRTGVQARAHVNQHFNAATQFSRLVSLVESPVER